MNYEKPDLHRPTKSNAIMFQLERFFFLVVKGNCPLENLYLILFASSLFYFLWHKGQRQCNIINGQKVIRLLSTEDEGATLLSTLRLQHYYATLSMDNVVAILLSTDDKDETLSSTNEGVDKYTACKIYVYFLWAFSPAKFSSNTVFLFFLLPVKYLFFSDLSLSSSPWSDSSGI